MIIILKTLCLRRLSIKWIEDQLTELEGLSKVSGILEILHKFLAVTELSIRSRQKQCTLLNTVLNDINLSALIN